MWHLLRMPKSEALSIARQPFENSVFETSNLSILFFGNLTRALIKLRALGLTIMETLLVSPFPTIDSFYGMKDESISVATASSTTAASTENSEKNFIALEASSQIERPLTTCEKARLLTMSSEATDNKDRPKFLDRQRFLERQTSNNFCIMQLLDPSTFHDDSHDRTLQPQPATAVEEPKEKSDNAFPSVFQRGEGEGGDVMIGEVNQVLPAMSTNIDDDVPIGSEAALDSSKQEEKKKKAKKAKKHKKHKKDDKKDDKKDKKDKKQKKDTKSLVPTSDPSVDNLLALPVQDAREEVRKQAETCMDDGPSLPKLASRVPTSDRNVDNLLALPVQAARKGVRKQAETHTDDRPSLPKLESQVPPLDRSFDDPLALPVQAAREEVRKQAETYADDRPSLPKLASSWGLSPNTVDVTDAFFDEHKSTTSVSHDDNKAKVDANVGLVKASLKAQEDERVSQRHLKSSPNRREELKRRQESSQSISHSEHSHEQNSSGLKRHSQSSRGKSTRSNTASMHDNESRSVSSAIDQKSWMLSHALGGPNFSARPFVQVKTKKIKKSEFEDGASEDFWNENDDDAVDSAWNSSASDLFAQPSREGSLRVEDFMAEIKSCASHDSYSRSEVSQLYQNEPALNFDMDVTWMDNSFTSKSLQSTSKSSRMKRNLRNGMTSNSSLGGSALSIGNSSMYSAASQAQPSTASVGSSSSSTTGMSRSIADSTTVSCTDKSLRSTSRRNGTHRSSATTVATLESLERGERQQARLVSGSSTTSLQSTTSAPTTHTSHSVRGILKRSSDKKQARRNSVGGGVDLTTPDPTTPTMGITYAHAPTRTIIPSAATPYPALTPTLGVSLVGKVKTRYNNRNKRFGV
jgi:hypothetical protein